MNLTATSEPLATMLLTYKCRLLPTKRQHRAHEAILEQQRQLYNAALQERIEAYAKSAAVIAGQIRRDREMGVIRRIDPDTGTVSMRRREHLPTAELAALEADEQQVLGGERSIRIGITEVDQSRSLTVIRQSDPAFAGVQRRIQRATLQRLDRAYKAFFKRAAAGAGASSGFPKFKGYEYFDGYRFDAFLQIGLDGKRLRFAGMAGGCRVRLDRPLPEIDGKTVIKGVWFKGDTRRRRGFVRWHAGFQCETPVRASRDGLGRGDIGVDWGTSVLAALSTGEMIQNPRHGEALAKEYARTQRSVARKKKGSKCRLKARRHMAAVARRIANRRRNTMDKVSSRLVKHWQHVAIAKLHVARMLTAGSENLPQFVKTRRNREALDAAPAMLLQMIGYKAPRENATRYLTDAEGKRDLCSRCGTVNYTELSDAIYRCSEPECLFTAPRKVNSARVALIRAGRGPGSVAKATNRGNGPGGSGNTGEGKTSSGPRPELGLPTTLQRRRKDPRLRSAAPITGRRAVPEPKPR